MRRLINGGDPFAKFVVPVNIDFGEDEFCVAEGVRPIANELIGSIECLSSLEEAAIVYLWKRKGQKSRGASSGSAAVRPAC